MPDDYLEKLEAEVAKFRAMLVPLESGEIRIGPGSHSTKLRRGSPT
jgi:hypothetical protein